MALVTIVHSTDPSKLLKEFEEMLNSEDNTDYEIGDITRLKALETKMP